MVRGRTSLVFLLKNIVDGFFEAVILISMMNETKLHSGICRLISDIRRDELNEMWGDLEAYYPESECTSELATKWETSKQRWITAVLAAAESKSLEDKRNYLISARLIEDQWGDSPSTDEMARKMGVEL